MKYREIYKRILIEDVTEAEVTRQLTEMVTADYYIIKDIELYFRGQVGVGAYFEMNSAATNVTATRFAERWYLTGSFVHLDFDDNGNLPEALTTKPYMFLSAGAGASTQDVELTLHYYAWNPT